MNPKVKPRNHLRSQANFEERKNDGSLILETEIPTLGSD
jgi:hypothetical protein